MINSSTRLTGVSCVSLYCVIVIWTIGSLLCETKLHRVCDVYSVCVCFCARVCACVQIKLGIWSNDEERKKERKREEEEARDGIRQRWSNRGWVSNWGLDRCNFAELVFKYRKNSILILIFGEINRNVRYKVS